MICSRDNEDKKAESTSSGFVSPVCKSTLGQLIFKLFLASVFVLIHLNFIEV